MRPVNYWYQCCILWSDSGQWMIFMVAKFWCAANKLSKYANVVRPSVYVCGLRMMTVWPSSRFVVDCRLSDIDRHNTPDPTPGTLRTGLLVGTPGPKRSIPFFSKRNVLEYIGCSRCIPSMLIHHFLAFLCNKARIYLLLLLLISFLVPCFLAHFYTRMDLGNKERCQLGRRQTNL